MKTKKYKGSIKNKLVKIILIVTIITTFIGYSSFIYWFMNNQYQKTVQLSHTIGLVLGQNIAKLILLDDISVAADITSQLKSFPNLYSMVLYNKKEKVIYRYSKDGKSFKIDPLPKHIDTTTKINNGFLNIYIKAKYQDTFLGYIKFHIKIEKIWCVVEENLLTMLSIWLIMFIISYLLAFYYAKEFTQPILKLVKFLENVDTINIINKKIKITQNNEYGLLYDEINTMLKRIKKSHKELETYKNNLEDIIEKKIEENTKQLNILQHQSKLAQMGEMIGSIAHQWRQPLNELSINIQKLKYDFLDNKLDKNFIENFVLENKQIINFMSKTIDDFRNFFMIDKLKEHFSIKQIIDNSLSIQKAQLSNHNIQVNLKGDDFTIYGYKNELQQVILNLMVNAKDILIEKNIQKPQIEIIFKNNTITVKDNGGGIPNNIVDRIFEPYYTTKEQGKGTGMGLYISKMIIEDNLKGKLTVINGLYGAHFIIDLTNIVEQNDDN